jgi:hypothetical protein
LQTRFPNVSVMLDQVRPRYESELGARLAVANALAFQVGWRLFEPLLRSAAGLDELTDADLRQAIGAEVARIVEPH